MSLSWVDVVLGIVILFGVYGGWRRGFILSALDLLRWIGSLAAALLFYQSLANWLAPLDFWDEVWDAPLAFILLMIVTSVIGQIIASALARRVPPETHRNKVDRAFGLLPGFAGGLITAAILSSLLFALPISDEFTEAVQKSVLADNFSVYTEQVESALVPIFSEAAQTLNRRTTKNPGSDERIDLPFKVESPKPRPDLEAAMLELVNRERARENLAPLAPDPEMTEVARKHSLDMWRRGYFAHNTPENKSPFDRMRDDRVKFLTAGENLALAPTLGLAHSGLMDSPGHRANILRPQFGRLGIGVLDGGRRGLMVTQNFRN